ncbi:cytochrome P450 CYP749A22-like [Malus sylvestris]|uniref:cytochrome P450 CYP749A22-like n=1 Tax=Malus domestica TaxID=3750 RepID=UPI0021ABF043|nr:cytochrome P450 CYP749A22-like [Malus sylvestris]
MSWFLFEMPVLTTSSFLCLLLVILLALLIKNFQKLWWTPNHIQNQMAAQGVHGPSYKFIHGSTKEILSMKRETMGRPRSLTHDIFSAVQPHIHAWSKIFGKNFLQWYGVQPQMIIAEPELCKEVLNNKDRNYRKQRSQGYIKKLLGDSISMAEGEKWVKLRKLAHHAFHGENLKNMIPEMIKSSETMVQRWKTYEGKEIEVNEEFRFFTSEVISRTAFGSSFLEGKNIFEMLRELTSLIFRNTFKLRFPGISMFYKTSDEIKSEKLEKGIRDIITEIVRKREKTARTGEAGGFGRDYLGILLKAHHDANEKQRISVDDLVDECKTFYFAGQETTNSLLAWTVFLLALHTDWQEEARKEVLELFGKENPNTDGLNKLKTMGMIINEALRLYPPVVSLTRESLKEVRLGQIVVPANVELHVANLALHHDPKYWGKDVQLFKPERFSEGVAKATNNNAVAFMPFGMGPRTCVGMNFAIIEAKIALSMILQRYSFTLSPGYVHSPIQFLTVRPQHGVQVILHPV